MREERAQLGAWWLLFLGLWWGSAGLFWGLWIRGTNHTDFYPWWAGVRIWLSSKGAISLYHPDTTHAIQQLLYNHPLAPSQDQQGFAYPAPLALLILPFAWMSNREIAVALWVGLGFALSAFFAYRWTRQWQQMLWVLSWPFMLVALYQAQIEPLLTGLLLGSALATARRRDALAGFQMPWLLLKPQATGLVVLAWVGYMLHARRYRALRAFALTMIIVFGGSLLLWGWWPLEWVAAVERYRHYAQVV